MTLAILLFIGALLMNSFFSGTETGFFRMTRLRLVMEAKTGDPVARILLWFANQPSVFVATALVGNNVANDLTSYSVVLATESAFPDGGTLSAVLPPLLVTPLMFICGDLLPKNVFFNAPNRLMRRSTPAVLVAAVLFAPVTLVLWLLSLVLALFTRDKPQELRMSLARRELSSILVEGHEAGILRPMQRTLAQTMLAVAGQPVRNFSAPAGRVVRVSNTMTRSEILRIAQRHRLRLLPVEDLRGRQGLVGFVRITDLILEDANDDIQPEPFVELSAGETFLSALSKLGVAQDALGRLKDSAGRTVGFVTGRELRQELLRASQALLR